jgi:hypothetical protein
MKTITKQRIIDELEGYKEEGYIEIEDCVTKVKRKIFIDGRLEGFGSNEVIITNAPKTLISMILLTLENSTVIE